MKGFKKLCKSCLEEKGACEFPTQSGNQCLDCLNKKTREKRNASPLHKWFKGAVKVEINDRAKAKK